MKVEELKIDKEHAREMWRKYQEHLAWQQPHDKEIAAIYKRIAQGKTVIRAFESIRAAGLNEEGLPKLAIARADQFVCFVNARNGHAVFSHNNAIWVSRSESRSKILRVPWDGFATPPTKQGQWRFEARVPLIPIHLRPQRGLQNYHILWEAEWTRRYPIDPYLLRRFGGDAWVVVAAWDLTDVERAVMSGRIRS